MANPFCHVELLTHDPAKAKEFYESLFDWKLKDVPIGDTSYTMIEAGEGACGGIMQNPVPGAPSNWLAYVLVDDVVASTEKVKALGAEVAQERIEVPGYGWFSVIVDPTSAAIGLWQPKASE